MSSITTKTGCRIVLRRDGNDFYLRFEMVDECDPREAEVKLTMDESDELASMPTLDPNPEQEGQRRHLASGDDAKAVKPVDLEPGDYLLTSSGDGTGRAIVTVERRLMVEQFGGGWSDLTDVYPCSSWRFEKVATPTPIDPADIRPGDVVEARRVHTAWGVDERYVWVSEGAGLTRDLFTWHLVHRPDLDEAAVVSDLERAQEWLGCERQEASFGPLCRKHQYRYWFICEKEAVRLAALLAETRAES